jgi:hypothetical protein
LADVTAPDRMWFVPTLFGDSLIAAYDTPASARNTATLDMRLA